MTIISGPVFEVTDDIYDIYDVADAASELIFQALYYNTVPGCTPDREPLECAFENIAKAVTKSIRDSPFMTLGYENANMTIGQTLVEQSFVYIRWQWITIPVLVWILAVMLWLGTAAMTWRRRAPVWRGNSMPLLFLYRESDEERERGAPGDPLMVSSAEFDERAARIRFNLK